MLTGTLTPGYQFGPTEEWDTAKFNLLGQPTIALAGDLTDLGNVSGVDRKVHTFTVDPAGINAGELILDSGHDIPDAYKDPIDSAHVLRAYFTTTGTLPANLTAETGFSYYIRSGGSGRLEVYTTVVDCLNQTNRLGYVGAGTGVHTVTWEVHFQGQPLIFDTVTSQWEDGIVGGQWMAEMVGATATANGTRGAVPQPRASDFGKFLTAAGDFQLPTQQTNDLFSYLHFL